MRKQSSLSVLPKKTFVPKPKPEPIPVVKIEIAEEVPIQKEPSSKVSETSESSDSYSDVEELSLPLTAV